MDKLNQFEDLLFSGTDELSLMNNFNNYIKHYICFLFKLAIIMKFHLDKNVSF